MTANQVRSDSGRIERQRRLVPELQSKVFLAMPKPTLLFKAACRPLAVLLAVNQWAIAAPELTEYFSLYYQERAIHKAREDYILLTDGRLLSIEAGRLIAPKSRVISNWNDFYRRSENPPISDLKVRLLVQRDRSLLVCLSDRCANVIRVCPPTKPKPTRRCLVPESISNLQKVE